jgi:hypothetical protein
MARQYTPLAKELIEYYRPRITPQSQNRVNALWRPDVSSDHLTEKYRAAWTELFVAITTKQKDEAARIADRVYEAMARVATPETIPVLIAALRRVSIRNELRQDVPDDEKYDYYAAQNNQAWEIVGRYEGIFNILVKIPHTNALETILTSLDVIEASIKSDSLGRYFSKVPLQERVRELRDSTFDQMIETNTSVIASFEPTRIKRGTEWEAVIREYQKHREISPKNQGLLERSRVFDLQRQKAEREKNPVWEKKE